MIKSRRIRWARNIARIGERKNAYSILMGKPERKSTGKIKTCVGGQY
jgi:hypothetical protein